MAKWEYRVLEFPATETKKLEETLNAAGAIGWEAVTSWGIKKGVGRDAAAVVLKRPAD